MTRKQTTPRRRQRLPQLGKTLPNAYLGPKTMIYFHKNTDNAAVMPQDSTSNLFLSLSGFSESIILCFSPPTNRAPKQFLNKISHKMFLDAVMADNNYFWTQLCSILHHTSNSLYVVLAAAAAVVQCSVLNTKIIRYEVHNEQCMYVARWRLNTHVYACCAPSFFYIASIITLAFLLNLF
jgi:hypothetical protein